MILADSDDPGGSDSRCSATMRQIEVDDITLAILIAGTLNGLLTASRVQQPIPKDVRIRSIDSEGGEYSSFVPASGMLEIEAISLKLRIIHHGLLAIRQLHLRSRVKN